MEKGFLTNMFTKAKFALGCVFMGGGAASVAFGGYAVIDGMLNSEPSGLYLGLSLLFGGAAAAVGGTATLIGYRLVKPHLKIG